MKILFLQYWYDMFGGAETVNHSLATQFNRDGYNVKIECLYRCHNNELIDNLTYDKEYICDEPKRPSYKNMLNKLLALKFKDFNSDVHKCIKCKRMKLFSKKELKRRILNYNPDWIIITNTEIVCDVPKNYLKKCIIHMHSGCEVYIKNKNLKNVKKILFKYQNKVSKLVWLSKGFLEESKKYGFVNGTYMYNPVRIKSSKSSNLTNNNIIFIGRIAPVKRIPLLTYIFNEFHHTNKDWNLNIYGSGNIEGLINNPNIHLMGSIDDVKKVLLKSDVFALTSLSEGFPMVVLEAYECGVPVITFRFKTSCDEVVKNGKTGFIVEMDNTNEYLNKLSKICNDKVLRENMGKNAKEYVKQFYPEVIAKRWYKLFKGEL